MPPEHDLDPDAMTDEERRAKRRFEAGFAFETMPMPKNPSSADVTALVNNCRPILDDPSVPAAYRLHVADMQRVVASVKALFDHVPEGVTPAGFVERLVVALSAPHANEHLIEFRNDGWTIQHPIAERIDGSMFDCPMANWDGGDIGYRGRYVLYADEDGQLNIAERIGGAS